MVFKYLLLTWGLVVFLLGALMRFRKNESIAKMIMESYYIFSSEFGYNDIKDKKIFSNWIGDVIIIEGALYTFLASAAIYFKINLLVIIAFIILIEIFFFKVISNGIKNFFE
ncbi:hypothetical protein JCM1393_23860 [Clostridium carnis]